MAIRVAIAGYGNVGRGVYKAIKRNHDMELAGIFSRRPEAVSREVGDYPGEFSGWVCGIEDTGEILRLKEDVDVAILCGGSKKDLFGEEKDVAEKLKDESLFREKGKRLLEIGQGPYFAQHFTTVDSFDAHPRIYKYFRVMDRVARDAGNVTFFSGGWDPGLFSMQRIAADAFIPGCKPQAFYGLSESGGLSMGHSDAIRELKDMGVIDGRQYTHAIQESYERTKRGENPDLKPGDKAWRECLVVVKEGSDKKAIEQAIKNMPIYYAGYETTVEFIPTVEELEKRCAGMPHDGLVIAVGETGDGNKASIEYRCQWESNPEATGSILVPCARAAYRLRGDGKAGAFTMIDPPLAYYNIRSREELLRKFI